MMATIKKIPAIRFKGFEEGWEERELREVVDIISTGKSFFVTNEKSDKNQYPILGSTSIIGYENDFDYSGDFLLTARVGANAGNLYQYSGNVKISDNTVFIQGKNVDFIFYLLEKFGLKRLSFGTGQPLIKSSELAKLLLKFPLPSEQTQIGNYFKQLDNLIQFQERKLEKATNLKKAMLEKMFPKENADVPEIRFKGFTEKWEKKKLEEVVNISSALRVHKNEWTTSGVPFFRSSDVVASYKGKENMKAYISNELYLKLSAISGPVKKGDILITGGGSIGIPYLVKSGNPLYFKDADLLWIKNINNINSYFLYTFFLTQVFRNYIESITHIGTISHYTIEQAKSTPITIPDSSEQQKIGTYFQNLDQLINQSQKEIEQLKHLKQALLKKMFI